MALPCHPKLKKALRRATIQMHGTMTGGCLESEVDDAIRRQLKVMNRHGNVNVEIPEVP